MKIVNKIKRKVALTLFGSKYDCPFCNFKTIELNFVGHDIPVLVDKKVIGGGRRAAGCPKCGSRDRERLLYAYFVEEIKILDNKQLKILHIAPEPKLSKVLLNNNFDEYICGDLFTEGYTYPAHVQNMNVLHLPFDNNKFDWVICNHVLEHIPDDLAAMSEIYRVLKPKGKALLQVPISAVNRTTEEDFNITDPQIREQQYGQFDHVRLYGQDYTKRLEKVGFQVERINISQKYPKMGVNPHEDLFIGNK